MIVGLIGATCSGKATLAQFLVEKYGFEAVDILELFRQKLAEIEVKNKQELAENKLSSPMKHFKDDEE